MKYILLIFSFLTFSASADNLKTIDLTANEFQQSLKLLKTYTVTTSNDPIYHTVNQKYEGFKFSEVLKHCNFDGNDETALRFVATDGYKTIAELKKLPLEKGYVVFKTTEGGQEKPFKDILEGKQITNPGPYILVWEGEYNRNLPYPFSLVRIEYGKLKAVYGKTYPSNSTDPKIVSGFHLFKHNCSSCHSMNKEGGVIGPELNVPKNITEYMKKGDIVNIIKNPNSYRWGSRMPGFENVLSDPEIDSVLVYMDHMKSEKVCTNLKECSLH